MPVKRRNHGRSRKGCGSTGKSVTCDGCGCRPPKDKVMRNFRPWAARGTRAMHFLFGRKCERQKRLFFFLLVGREAGTEILEKRSTLITFRVQAIKRFRVTNIVESSAIRDIREASAINDYVLPKVSKLLMPFQPSPAG